jgi:signal transduction histidine kinase
VRSWDISESKLMKKVAVIFVLAVLLPSLVLAWLAVRSLHDQQFLLERQQSLLYQHVTDSLAQNISDSLAQQQQQFSAQVENLVGDHDPNEIAAQFDDKIRALWPLAEVGFCVTLSGKILSPPPNARPDAQMFRLDNSAFLGNREVVEVYRSLNNGIANNNSGFGGIGGGVSSLTRNASGQSSPALDSSAASTFARAQNARAVEKISSAKQTDQLAVAAAPSAEIAYDNAAQKKLSEDQSDSTHQVTADSIGALNAQPLQSSLNYKVAELRKVSPQSQAYQITDKDKTESLADEPQANLSRVVPAEAEFAQLIGNESDGMLARFLQNKLKLMFWHRLKSEPDLIFGAQLNLNRVVENLRSLIQPDRELQNEICLALLDDNAKPVAVSRNGFQANWKRPFVATEIGDALPHWEIAAYLVNPAQLTQAARTAKLTLGLLVALLLLAIGVGSWLIVSNLNSELKLARQKTDFVSNVSHELKTPLTSIRMFSELLAENRVTDAAKQKSYLHIITAEAARLTRLINNVLDFSRMESGEKKYNFQPCDLTEIVRTTAELFHPHLEANGFKFDCELPETKIPVRGDADALSQVIVNLLSNAEKYSNGKKEIMLQVTQKQSPLPHAEIKVLDRGSGVPRGSEEKIFEKFYRAHDSLASGIQGSGLGLTIARQIARAHSGDVFYEPREGGGSCFILRLPTQPT